MARNKPILVALESVALVALIAGPFVLGGMPVAAVVTQSALLLLTALLLVSWRNRPGAHGVAASPLTVGWTMLIVLALFQTSRLSGPFASTHSAAAWDLWDGGARTALAPHRAWIGIVRMVAFVSALTLGQSLLRRGQTARARIAIVWVSTLCSLIGIVHHLLGLDAVFGLYTPQQLGQITTRLAAPFVNPNQAAALIGLGSICAVIEAEQSATLRRALYAVIALGLSTMVILLAGRAAIAALIAAGVVTAAVMGPNRWRGTRGATSLGIGGALLLSLGLLALTIYGRGRVHFFDLDKALTWEQALQIFRQSPLQGFGAGAFGDLQPSVVTAFSNERHAYVESQPLQLLVDHGLIGLLVVSITLAWTLMVMTRRRKGPQTKHLGALVAVTTYALVEACLGMGAQSVAYLAFVGYLLGSLAKPGPTRRVERGGLVVLGTLAVMMLMSTQWLRPALTLQYFEPFDENGEPRIAEPAHYTPGSLQLIAHEAEEAVGAEQLERADELVTYLSTFAPLYPPTSLLNWALADAREDDSARCEALADIAAHPRLGQRVARPLLESLNTTPREWVRCLGDTDEALEDVFSMLPADSPWRTALAMPRLREPNPPRFAFEAMISGLRSIDAPELAIRYAHELEDVFGADEDSSALLLDLAVESADMEAALTILESRASDLPPRSWNHLPRVLDSPQTRQVYGDDWCTIAVTQMLTARDRARAGQRRSLDRGYLNALIECESWPEARAMALSLGREIPDDPTYPYLRGLAAERMHDRAEARQSYRQAINISPTHRYGRLAADALEAMGGGRTTE